MEPVATILSLVERAGFATRAGLGLWACDCARRAVHEVPTVRRPHDPRGYQLLRIIDAHFHGRAADLDHATRLAALLEREAEGRGLALAQATTAAVDHALDRVDAATVAEHARAALTLDLPTEQLFVGPPREPQFEARWQARRLLWRTGAMPRFPDMLVRLDLAEAAGAAPRSGPALQRFDALRVRIHADEDARLDLILEFGDALFLRELAQTQQQS